MTNRLLITVLLSAIAIAPIIAAKTDTSARTSTDDDGISSFHLALTRHYGQREHVVRLLMKERLSEEEMAVAFFLAENTATSARILARIHLEGVSWMAIARRYSLTAEVFYVDVKDAGGPPYGKAYRHFKHKKRKAWRKLNLSDAEIINLVNLRFLSEFYGYPVVDIIKMREEGHTFVKVGHTIKRHQKKRREKHQVAKAEKKKVRLKTSRKSDRPE